MYLNISVPLCLREKKYTTKDAFMLITMLKSKLHFIRVTSAEPDYEGSMSLDRDFMDAVGLHPFEKILVANRENGNRFETYVIEAPRGSRTAGLNGATALLGKKGDRVIVFAFCQLTEEEQKTHRPKVAVFGEGNAMVRKTGV